MKNNLVKILATLGLIVAIALILKGVFGVGEIGVKKFSKKFSKSKKLPKLECTIRVGDKNTKMTYDLQKIKDNRPKDIPTDLMESGKYFSKDPMYLELFSESEQNNQYNLNIVSNKNGKDRGYTVDINRTTGDLELNKLPDRPIGLSFKENLALIQDGKMKTVYGSCYKIKR